MGAPGASPLGTWDSTDSYCQSLLFLDFCSDSLYASCQCRADSTDTNIRGTFHFLTFSWQVAHSMPLHPSVPPGKMNLCPHSSRLYRDEWAAESRRPFRLDFDHSSNSGGHPHRVDAPPAHLQGIMCTQRIMEFELAERACLRKSDDQADRREIA